MSNRPDAWNSWPVEVREVYEILRRGYEELNRGGDVASEPLEEALNHLFDLAQSEVKGGEPAGAAWEAIEALPVLEFHTPEAAARAREEYRRSGRPAFDLARMVDLAKVAPPEQQARIEALIALYAPLVPHGKA